MTKKRSYFILAKDGDVEDEGIQEDESFNTVEEAERDMEKVRSRTPL